MKQRLQAKKTGVVRRQSHIGGVLLGREQCHWGGRQARIHRRMMIGARGRGGG